jgi:hypothetical protein
MRTATQGLDILLVVPDCLLIVHTRRVRLILVPDCLLIVRTRRIRLQGLTPVPVVAQFENISDV